MVIQEAAAGKAIVHRATVVGAAMAAGTAEGETADVGEIAVEVETETVAIATGTEGFSPFRV